MEYTNSRKSTPPPPLPKDTHTQTRAPNVDWSESQDWQKINYCGNLKRERVSPCFFFAIAARASSLEPKIAARADSQLGEYIIVLEFSSGDESQTHFLLPLLSEEPFFYF